MKNLNALMLLPASIIITGGLQNARADNASVTSATLSENSMQATADAPLVGILADSIKLADIEAGALDVGDCTFANFCINYFDPSGGNSNSASSTDTGKRDAVKEIILAWRGLRTGATFEIGVAPTRTDAHFNNLNTQMALTSATVVNPTWAPVSQTTFQTFLGNNNLVYYTPPALFSISHAKLVEVGMYKTVSGTPTVASTGDGGKFVAPGAGPNGNGLPFNWGTHPSPLYAAGVGAARTNGADKTTVTNHTSADFAALSGTASDRGRIIGTTAF